MRLKIAPGPCHSPAPQSIQSLPVLLIRQHRVARSACYYVYLRIKHGFTSVRLCVWDFRNLMTIICIVLETCIQLFKHFLGIYYNVRHQLKPWLKRGNKLLVKSEGWTAIFISALSQTPLKAKSVLLFNEKETTASKKCQQNSGRQRADHHAVADLGFCFLCSAKCKWEETTKQVPTYAMETGEGAGIGGTKDCEKQEWIKRRTAG